MRRPSAKSYVEGDDGTDGEKMSDNLESRSNDRDLIGLTMQQAGRLSTEIVGPNPFKGGPAIETMREVLDQEPRTMTARPDPQMAGVDLSRAIHLRWTLRDIRSGRTNLSPISPDDLRTLIETGLIEMQDDVPVLTIKGRSAID